MQQPSPKHAWEVYSEPASCFTSPAGSFACDSRLVHPLGLSLCKHDFILALSYQAFSFFSKSCCSLSALVISFFRDSQQFVYVPTTLIFLCKKSTLPSSCQLCCPLLVKNQIIFLEMLHALSFKAALYTHTQN